MRWAGERWKWRVCLLGVAAALFASNIQAAPSINAPNVNPSTLAINQPTSVTASCQINTSAGDPALIAGGVNLVRIAGTASSVVGTMQDAGNGLYSLTYNDSETSVGSFQLQCTAAFKGMLQRVKSPVTTVTVVSSSGGGSIGTVTFAPSSITYGVAISVTLTAPVTGTPDPGSVMLQQLDSSGRVLAILGTLHDDGLNGDPVANDGNYTLVTNFTEFTVGTIPLRVSATFSNAVNHALSPIANLTVTGTPPPTVTITSPSDLSYLNLSPTTVSGTVSDPTARVVINAINAPVDLTGKFSATVPLTEGPNILTATATSPSGTAGTASITVTLDTTPPHVTITSPTDQFITTAASVSIAGNVNDIVVGTVNSQQATVTVNGVAGHVANRTFLAQNVPLSMGSNRIQAVAVDRAGNQATTQITVIRQAPQPGQISLVSGNNQTGTIGTALSAPLVVSLTDSTGAPAVNKQVLLSVTQNNGMLSGNSGTPAASVLATTDANGNASANWTLGMRSGAGSDAVQAYSVGYSGIALFTASANQGTPGLIVVDTGNNQTGSVNQPLPKPFIAVVIDAGNNRLPNVPVTFTVVNGGGSFAGQPSTTVTTDSDGRAAATLTLGFQEGNSNNLVAATFPANTGSSAKFTASGLGPGNPNVTVISGVVLDNSNNPIAGATVRALLDATLYSNPSSAQTAASVQTDATGHFSIYKAPVGYVKLFVDGSTSSTPGPFPILEYDMVTVAGQVNTVNRPIFLVALKTSNQLCVTDTTGGGTLTIADAPGFSLTFGPGQVTFPGGSKTGCVSVTQVHPDKVPMEPAFGQQPRFIVTIQPAGAIFNPPAPITIPNVDGLRPREVTEMYSYDHDISSFVAIGTGTVSDDGQVIRSNAGVGVLKAGWHCGGNPTATGCTGSCGPCAFCDHVACTCNPNPIQGNACKDPCLVGGQGICSNGYCTGTVKVGAPCGNGGVCDKDGVCVYNAGGGGGGGGCSGGCNSSSPCFDASCSNGKCTVNDNGQCEAACAGRSDGTSCSVDGIAGVCEGGICDLCGSQGSGTLCACPGGAEGTCDAQGNCNCSQPQLSLTWRLVNSVSLSSGASIVIHQGSSASNYYDSAYLSVSASQPGGTFLWTSDDDSIVSVSNDPSAPDGHIADIVGLRPGVTNLNVSYTLNGATTATASISVQDIYPILLVHGFNSNATGAWGGPGGLATIFQEAGVLQGNSLCNSSDAFMGDVDFCAVDFCADPTQASGAGPTCAFGPLSQWGSFSDFLNVDATGAATEQDEGFWLGIVIGNLLSSTGADKVTILAHSMGGLASRAYLEFYDGKRGQDVDKLITIGTPNLGTPWASIATDPVFQSVPAVQVLNFVGGILGFHLESPSVVDMDPSSRALAALNRAALPSSVSYVSIIGEAAASDANTYQNQWFQLVDTLCNLGPGSQICEDLQGRTPTIDTFLTNSDLVVPIASQNLAIAVPGSGANQVPVFGITHSPLPFVSSPFETEQIYYFLQALGLQTNPRISQNVATRR